MIKGKEFYLKKLTSRLRTRSVHVGKDIDGSTPPSVFIGSWNYPRVYAGPLIAPLHGDTALMDSPEQWIPEGKTQEDIIGFRLDLVRGKRCVDVKATGNGFVERLQEISLSKDSIDSEASFKKEPRGMSFDGMHTPHGPSATLESLDIGNPHWDKHLEKTFYDTDLKAGSAVIDLHGRGLDFSRIQKAFSSGTMGIGRNRRLVPTRWSITACDSILGDSLLDTVRHCDILDCFRVHEYASLNNYYAVLLLPTFWQYEWMEAFIHVLGREEMIFADHEYNTGKRGYSVVGGCYYSCKMGVLEALARERKQAGAIIFREAYPGYVPLGVFNVRENVRSAMNQNGREFYDMRSALSYISTRLRLPLSRFERESTLLKELMRYRQTTLSCY